MSTVRSPVRVAPPSFNNTPSTVTPAVAVSSAIVSVTSDPLTVVLPEDVIVVNAPVDAVVAPIVVLSIVPALMSAVVRTASVIVVWPVVSAIDTAAVPSLAFTFVTCTVGVVTDVVTVTASGSPTVRVCPDAEVSISLDVPAIVNDWLSRSTAPVPVSPAKSRSCAVTWLSTYALIDCCVAKAVALSDTRSSSSRTAVTSMLVDAVPSFNEDMLVTASTTFVPSQNTNIVCPSAIATPVPAEVLIVTF